MKYKIYAASLAALTIISAQLSPASSEPVTPIINPRSTPKPSPAVTTTPTPPNPPIKVTPTPKPTPAATPTPKPSPSATITPKPSPANDSSTTTPPKETVLFTQTGEASWYGSEGGPLTATGERYNPQGMTAAHRTIAFGSKVRVTNLRSGRSAIVTINDRGPYAGGRIIDLSAAAAEAVGIKSSGVGKVRIEVLSYGSNKRKGRR